MNAQIKRLPYRYYFLPTLLFCLAGVVVTSYLIQSHYRNYTDMAYASFCAISKAINCDTVSQSPWAVIFGLPVAIWGLFGYLLYMLFLIPLSRENSQTLPLWKLLFILGWVYSLTALFFAYISARIIHSFCIMCVASYAVSFTLLFQSWLISRRFGIAPFFPSVQKALAITVSNKRIYIPLMSLIVLMLLMKWFLPHYWELKPTEISDSISQGTTSEGHPWIGAANPVLTITEFSDFQCFQCKKMHFYLRQLVEGNPEKIRLVHRNFPMDRAYNPLVKEPFHVGSGKMALYSLYAAEKGNFWLFSDLLFDVDTSEGHFNLRGMAKEAGLDVYDLARSVKNPLLLRKLMIDIRDGLKLGITGTPSYIIDGKVYEGNIPPEKIAFALKK